MITFLDENDVEYGALATIKATNAVNGERSLTGTIVSGDYVLSNIERGWRLRFDDEYYVVTYAKPIDEGRDVQVEFDAVHQFFWDFDKSSVYDQLSDGSHTFRAYLDFIFKNSGYSYTVDSALNVYAFEKQSFGLKKRLTLFNDIITSTGVEFQVNGKVVRILEKVGTDLSTVVRKNFNMNELTIEKNIGDFVTYQKGYGAYFDEEDHSKGRLEVEYTSPLASVYGRLEAEPFVDERYSQSSSLLAVLKENVDNSYTISVALDMEDLTRAGYKYKQPIAGDYIMAINETLDFQEKIRIVSFTSEYDVQGILVKHEVTCNDIGTVKKLSASYNLTKKQAASASNTASNAYSIANKALVSADGKNTNYYGDSFPVDNPKGTLKTGDLLFLTVGDTVKQYYWNGADWVINPVLDDVEAFKEQISEELKDVPNREEFENKIAEEVANSKAEIETQIETAKTQAESNAKEYADTINQETAKVAELANAAADEIKADLVNVKNNLTATSLVANNAQAAVDAAKQDLTNVANELNTAKQDLANSVAEVNTKVNSTKEELTQAKQDLMSHAQQLQTQANAQTELTKRVTTVETTANGTKTTVNELTKTVAQNGKDITSVTNRTKAVEDDLANTKTTLTQVQTTANSTSQKTATLETGLDGLNAKFDNLKIGGTNLLLYSADPWQAPQTGYYQFFGTAKTSETYNGAVVYKTGGAWSRLGINLNNHLVERGLLKVGDVLTYSVLAKTDQETPIQSRLFVRYNNQSGTENINGKNEIINLTKEWQKVSVTFTVTEKMLSEENRVNYLGWEQTTNSESGKYVYYTCNKIERGNVPTDYSPNDADLEQKVAEYKQNADQNYASLQTTVQNLDGTVKQNKSEFDQTASQIKSSISSVEGKIPTNVSTRNLILKSNDFANPHKQTGANTTVTSTDDYFVIKSTGYTANAWGGMSWNMSISEMKAGEQFSILMPVYIDSSVSLDNGWAFALKNHPSNSEAYSYGIPTNKKDQWFNVAITFTASKDVVFDTYPFYVYLVKNGLVRIKPPMLVRGNLIPSDYQPAFEDTKSDVTKLNTTLTQTANGLEQLSTQVTSQGSTIISHTNSINSLTTGLSAKVSQSDFNTLSGRVTTAENNITAKANELSSKITSVEGKIPTSVGGRNLWIQSKVTGGFVEETLPDNHITGQKKCYRISNNNEISFNIEPDFSSRLYRKVTFSAWVKYDNVVQGQNNWNVFNCFKHLLYYKNSSTGATSNVVYLTLEGFNGTSDWKYITYTYDYSTNKSYNQLKTIIRFNLESARSGTAWVTGVKVEIGSIPSDYTPAPEDTAEQISNLSSELKQTTDAIKASVTSLDNSTVKSSSLTINADGIVMKAGKSTTDVANAIGSYFAVNQNAINLFSDKINVKGNMIVSGAITSDKIASKSINTAHLNGKIITADVISSNAVTADAIKAGAVTTDKMNANSINGDRITAGTLDAAKIKAGSITASQIASGTITSNQIKAGGISAANIATGAITTDKIAAGAIDANKIAANAITANMITGGQLRSTNGATVFDLNAGTLTFNNNSGYIERVAGDKIFAIQTWLGADSNSRDWLASSFSIRKSDNSRRSGIQFQLYNDTEDKPTAFANIWADSFHLGSSKGGVLFYVDSTNNVKPNWGDIPVAHVNGGLLVQDIAIGGHSKSLLNIVEELCKKAGIPWV